MVLAELNAEWKGGRNAPFHWCRLCTARIAEQYRQRKYVDFTPDLVREAARNAPVRLFGAAWDSRRKPTVARQTWRNGYSRAGKLATNEDWTVAQFLIRTEAAGAPKVSQSVVER